MIIRSHFTIRSKLSAEDAVSAISALLARRSVEYRIAGNSIISTYVPIVLMSWDWRGHSRDNWVGINPFLLVDTLIVDVSHLDNDGSRVDVIVTHIRPYVPLLIIAGTAISVDDPGNELFARALFAGAAVLYYLFVFIGTIRGLLPSEIRRVVRQGQ